jgi:SagB-type dehydrogenase family enzyme
MAPRTLWLSPFTTVEWREGAVSVRSLLHDSGVTDDESDLLTVLHAFAKPRTLPEAAEALDLPVAELGALVAELAELGIVVDCPPPCHWQLHDLAFHETSTAPSDVKTPGANPFPAVRPPMASSRTELRRSPPAAPGGLAELLAERRSVRHFAATPVPIDAFSTLLERSFADRGSPMSGTVRRPYPSGGALHSLEVYPVVPPGAVVGLEAGVYHYAASMHALEHLAVDDVAWRLWMPGARTMAVPEGALPIVLLVTSRIRRVQAGYRDVAYRLVLVELGCLMQTVYLVAQDLGLGACALGGIDHAERLAELGGFDVLEEPLVGEMVVGPAADE